MDIGASNIAVTGLPGAGKTYFIKKLLCRSKEKAFVLDYEGEYEKMASELGHVTAYTPERRDFCFDDNLITEYKDAISKAIREGYSLIVLDFLIPDKRLIDFISNNQSVRYIAILDETVIAFEKNLKKLLKDIFRAYIFFKTYRGMLIPLQEYLGLRSQQVRTIEDIKGRGDMLIYHNGNLIPFSLSSKYNLL